MLTLIKSRSLAFMFFVFIMAADGFAQDVIVHFKTGRTLEGQIVKETDDAIDLKIKFGTITYKKSDIQKIERLDAASGDQEINKYADLRDVIVLIDGRELVGLVARDFGGKIAFDIIASGSAVSKTLMMQMSIDHAEIESKQLLSPELRAKVRKYLATVKREAKQDLKKEKELVLKDGTWNRKDGKGTMPMKYIELEHFVLESNLDDEEYFKKVAYRISKVFNAYKEHFGVSRNKFKKIHVQIMNSMQAYYGSIDYAVKNPAFYMPSMQLIFAGCDLSLYKREIAKITKAHAALLQEIKKVETQITTERRRVRGIVEKFKKQISVNGLTTPQGAAAIKQLRKQEWEWSIQLGKYKLYLNELKKKIRRYDRSNAVLFDKYSKGFLEMIYHEGFHAFLDQFLFDTRTAKAVPLWLDEGLAQYFESSRIEGSRLILGQKNKMALKILGKIQREDKLQSLESMLNASSKDYMVTSNKEEDMQVSHMNYFQAWVTVYILGESGRINNKNMQSFVQALMQGESPANALPILTGVSNDEFREKMKTVIDNKPKGMLVE